MWYLIVSIPDLCTLTYFKDLSIDEMVGAQCFGCLSGPLGFVCWISFAPVLVVFVALRPKSTAMVMGGRSVYKTTLFPGQA